MLDIKRIRLIRILHLEVELEGLTSGLYVRDEEKRVISIAFTFFGLSKWMDNGA